jgi:hypothetical protein
MGKLRTGVKLSKSKAELIVNLLCLEVIHACTDESISVGNGVLTLWMKKASRPSFEQANQPIDQGCWYNGNGDRSYRLVELDRSHELMKTAQLGWIPIGFMPISDEYASEPDALFPHWLMLKPVDLGECAKMSAWFAA